MKSLFYLVVFIFCGFTLLAQEKGVDFQKLTFREALDKAAKEGKMVFLDGYTTWCGPCKYMSEKVFTRQALGDYMNPRFVCVKFDMEKGEGVELNKRLGIQAYPTFVLLKPDGTVYHKLVGGAEAEEFIVKLEKVLADSAEVLEKLDARYRSGERSKEFLLKYTQALSAAYDSRVVPVSRELCRLLNDEEKTSDTYWFIYGSRRLSPDHSENCRYLLDHREAFDKTVGKEKVDNRLYAYYVTKIKKLIERDSLTAFPDSLNQMRKEIASLHLRDEKMLFSFLRITQAKLEGDTGNLLAVCEREFPAFQAPEKLFSVIFPAVEYLAGHAGAGEMLRLQQLGQTMISRMDEGEFRNAVSAIFEKWKQR